MAAEPKPNATTETNVMSVLRNMISSSRDLRITDRSTLQPPKKFITSAGAHYTISVCKK